MICNQQWLRGQILLVVQQAGSWHALRLSRDRMWIGLSPDGRSMRAISCDNLRCCLSELAGRPCRYELGRQPAMTKLSSNVTVRRVRVRGGNFKFRALRLDSGNFSWGSEVSRGLAG